MRSNTCSGLIVYYVRKTLILPGNLLARNPEIAGLTETVEVEKVCGTCAAMIKNQEWREGEKRGMVDDNEAKTVRYLTAGMRLDGMYSTVQW